jgi:hypothetical protein
LNPIEIEWKEVFSIELFTVQYLNPAYLCG